jgi:glycosyltransferase involved in cell wall biosynthesis
MIGIVTISFNQAQFLPEAIRSVASNCARHKAKYVVVDPGSGDGSREIILAANVVDISIFEPDQGPSDGLNKGIQACSDCEIIGYVNADDRLAPNATQWVSAFFESNPATDVVLGAVKIIDEAGQSAVRARVCDTFDLGRYALGTCLICQQGTFFRRSAWEKAGGFNRLNRTCWDSELIVDMALSGARMTSVRKILGEFRIHPASITGSGRTNDKFLRDQQRIREKIWATGVDRPARWKAGLSRLLYKCNPARHLSYLTVR